MLDWQATITGGRRQNGLVSAVKWGRITLGLRLGIVERKLELHHQKGIGFAKAQQLPRNRLPNGQAIKPGGYIAFRTQLMRRNCKHSEHPGCGVDGWLLEPARASEPRLIYGCHLMWWGRTDRRQIGPVDPWTACRTAELEEDYGTAHPNPSR